MLLALQASARLHTPIRLATMGWTVGPMQDQTLPARLLPVDVVVSSLIPGLGTYPVEPGMY